ncbi:TonB-dependent copper receptor [Mycobacteroides abscessus subsp. abscessus]|nr:TonB-dependent copper receptor [Mycobacteroides abscessus subsp. abscessus]
MYAWGENTTNNSPLPQISPLEGRLNLRYVQDKYTLGALLRVVDGQSRISKYEGNIVGYDEKESSGFGVLLGAYQYEVLIWTLFKPKAGLRLCFLLFCNYNYIKNKNLNLEIIF